MLHPAAKIIQDEHSALAAMLRSLLMLVDNGPGEEPERFFDIERAVLFYIDEFPEKVHHTKESDLLFPKLRERSGELAAVLDRLDGDHRSSHRAVRELEHELTVLEMMSDAADYARRCHACQIHDIQTSTRSLPRPY